MEKGNSIQKKIKVLLYNKFSSYSLNNSEARTVPKKSFSKTNQLCFTLTHQLNYTNCINLFISMYQVTAENR